MCIGYIEAARGAFLYSRSMHYTHLAELFILPDKGMRAVSIKTKKLEPGSLFEVYWLAIYPGTHTDGTSITYRITRCLSAWDFSSIARIVVNWHVYCAKRNRRPHIYVCFCWFALLYHKRLFSSMSSRKSETDTREKFDIYIWEE